MLSLHQRLDRGFGRFSVVDKFSGLKDHPSVEQMRKDVGIVDPRVFSLNVKHNSAVLEVMIVSKDR